MAECKRCGTGFTPSNGNQRYCTKRCQKAGELERHRAKLVPMTCAHCGAEFMGRRWHQKDAEHKRRYCSAGCDADAKRWRYIKRTSSPLDWRECQGCQQRFISRNGKDRCASCPRVTLRIRYSRSCDLCGSWLTTWQPHQRHCSRVCARRAMRDRYRTRLTGAFVEPVYRVKVYERDRWTCRLCGEPVDLTARVPDPLAPTLDHILPLALGGEHSYANAQCAHYRCNHLKGAKCEEQMVLI